MDDRATTSRVSVLSYGLMVLGLAVLLVSTGPGADDRQGAVESSWIRAAAADDDPPPSGKDGQETDEPILGKDFPFEGPSERWPPRDRTPFPGRYADARHQAGNSRQADEAVGRALRWLAAHQSPDGRWEAGGFHHWCDGKPSRDEQPIDGQGKPLYDVGVTGLALAAYLGAGYTNRGDHDFAKTVGRGLKYLKDVQDPEGCFGPRSTQQYAYNHAAASLAMVEAYGMTGSPIFKGTAQRAVTFITQARNPYFAWRYGIKPGDNDTSITGWMGSVAMSARTINAAAIESGKPAPLVFEDTPIVDGIRNWLD
ncbi:MAG: terpene cyclase/mutase family protein, partial [Planctomycetes bacterium]|nr:terpene cyclase/mutase family protein [Planctomycetota bacterium]